MGVSTLSMSDAQRYQALDKAGASLRRSVERVRRGRGAALRRGVGVLSTGAGERGRAGVVDQVVAGAQAVVWVAAWVQSIFNEIRGRDDEL